MTPTLDLTINGESLHMAIDPRLPLVDLLRDHLRLTGAKAVCREGFCGACLVQVDGVPLPACLLPVGSLTGRAVVTIEAMGTPDAPNPVQQALLDHDAVQCGMCFPGMVMTLTHLLATTPAPTRAMVKTALVGNICRCTGYERIIDAALDAARNAAPAPEVAS